MADGDALDEWTAVFGPELGDPTDRLAVLVAVVADLSDTVGRLMERVAALEPEPCGGDVSEESYVRDAAASWAAYVAEHGVPVFKFRR